ncbi:hypothetical protein [Tardiphaga sp. 42S5]|uniref:hypothetical protein n=1 Tax=Tardiphaga sp. 42S5 TaxID=1404799 RepID=UPI002A5AB489|nr:hypothetical protein [Tardiphaga sp. 42S5]WPO43203.1 hypothetical protein SFY93_08680 [Tardiphaga sp. 42S5]
MSARTQISKTPRDHFMEIAQAEMDEFERRERELRRKAKRDRAAELKLPIDVGRGSLMR